MSEPAPKLKEVLNAAAVRSLAAEVKQAWPAFNAAAFTRHCLRGLEGLELADRARHIAEGLQQHLPQPFPQAAQVLAASLGPVLAGGEDNGFSVLRFMPHVAWVQQHGLAHFDEAMAFQLEITQRFSAEWSIRAYLEQHPERTYAQLQRWLAHPSVHVRRLVSEGTRPRLPWAPRLRAFQRDPGPVLMLLEALKDDPERYVQRSVANNLNDIAKDHPDRVVEVCARWWREAGAAAGPGATEQRRWIVTHALRSLVKQGHAQALALLGAGAAPSVKVLHPKLTPKQVPWGGHLSFQCELLNEGDKVHTLVVDYAVHYMKANGQTRPKVFKLRRLRLAPGERAQVHARLSLADLSTRRHHPGRHAVELRINGAVHSLGEFVLRA